MKKSLVKQFTHLVAGLFILAHSFQAFEKEDTKTSLLFLIIALLLVLIAGVHLWLERQIRKMGAIFFLFEALALYYSAWKYKADGDKTMFIISAVVASYYVGYAAYIFSSKSRHRKKHRSSRSSRTNLDDLN